MRCSNPSSGLAKLTETFKPHLPAMAAELIAETAAKTVKAVS